MQSPKPLPLSAGEQGRFGLMLDLRDMPGVPIENVTRSPATMEHERKASAPFWTGRHVDHPGKAGRWIGNTWYFAKPRQHVREAIGNIRRELIIIGDTVHCPLPPDWAVF